MALETKVKNPPPAENRRSRSAIRWLLPLAAGVVAAAVAVSLLLFQPAPVDPVGKPGSGTAASRFAPDRPVTEADLASLRWDEVDQAVAAISPDPTEIERVSRLARGMERPPAVYLGALLLVSQREAEQALASFGKIDPQVIPPGFLYAPYRLHQALEPTTPNPYLPPLRKAVAAGLVSPLIQARVQVRDGQLSKALGSYLKTDPADWASYDLETLQRIANHQGLAADLSKMIGGALASGRVKPRLAPALQRIATQPATQPDIEAFKEELRLAVESDTPVGRLAVESARSMLRDRKLFVARRYRALLDLHSGAEPVALPTETALLLFLAAVDLKEQLEIDRWGQELKRRHAEPEVRRWVNEMTADAR